jgi:hypothetical protein
METARIEVDRKQARDLYRKYKEHRAYSEPIDWEIQRTYQLLAHGNVIIKAIESIKLAGLNEKHLPKLALAPATATHCHLRRNRNGSIVMGKDDDFNAWRKRTNQIRLPDEAFHFPADSFPLSTWAKVPYRLDTSNHRAALPIIPIHLRPKRGLANYHVLWEAEWERVVPRDPYLLRRIGKADLWLVVAHWDLTEVERAALATRVA